MQIIQVFVACYCSNSHVKQLSAPPAVDSAQAKMQTASWENVHKQMPRNTKLHISMFQMTENVAKMTSAWNALYYNNLHSYRSINLKKSLP